MKRVTCLFVLCLIALPGGACRKNVPPPSAATMETTTEEIPVVSREDLYAEWAAGRFTKLSGADIPAKLHKYLSVDDEAGLSTAVLAALEKTLAAFLIAYGSTDFEKYIAFRDPATMANPDDSRVRQRIDAVTRTWNPHWGTPPSDGLGVTHFAWRMYVEGEMPGLDGGPAIERVKWTSCYVHVGFLRKDDVDPNEWDQNAGHASHFLRTLKTLPVAAALASELRPAVPNRLSAVEIANRDGEIVFADFEIVQTAGDLPPHPLLVRFIHDRSARRWLPLNMVKVENKPPRLFIW